MCEPSLQSFVNDPLLNRVADDGSRQMWYEEKGELIEVPTKATDLVAQTPWLEKNCIQTMGKSGEERAHFVALVDEKLKNLTVRRNSLLSTQLYHKLLDRFPSVVLPRYRRQCHRCPVSNYWKRECCYYANVGRKFSAHGYTGNYLSYFEEFNSGLSEKVHGMP